MRLPIACAGLLLLLPGLAAGESGSRPDLVAIPTCQTLPEASPAPGATIPSNLPAFWFQPAIHFQGGWTS